MKETGPEEKVSAVLDALAAEVSSAVDGSGTRDPASLLGSVGILAAVSGGSDSVAMLCLLHDLAGKYGFSLSVITVNHMIRTESESRGDARFVASLCEALDPPVPCTVVDLEPGEVARVAAGRGRGIEEAARFIRYQRFESTAQALGARFVMTAHTRNDQLETVLMRFFQGSGGAALGGIAVRRGLYVRPLLDCTRAELRDLLAARGIVWREDGTNTDDRYLRNRLRLKVVPLLDEIMPGWDSSVLSLAERSLRDDEFCRGRLDLEWVRDGDRLRCPAEAFARLHPALRFRFLQDGLKLLAAGHRVPAGFLERIVDSPRQWPADPERTFRIAGSGLSFVKDGNSLFWGADIVHTDKSGYLVYIRAPGRFCLPAGTVAVSGNFGVVYIDGRLGPFSLPLVIRSRMGGDTVRTADGKRKTLKKLMNDWSVSAGDRDLIPVIEESGTIRAVYGSLAGYPDWFVQT
jgi:tRNA(Ile)-lysidine synthase